MHDSNSSHSAPNQYSFHTTHWSLVLAASQVGAENQQSALSSLCETYWYPLYCYVRHHESDAAWAQDITQDFFVRLLEKNVLTHATPTRGRFRAFLLSSMKNFMANSRDKGSAEKRGGKLRITSLDWQAAESRIDFVAAKSITSDDAFDRAWATSLLERVLERLQEEFTIAGKNRQFDLFKVLLTGEKSGQYSQIADELKISEPAVRQAVHRMRKRYRELLIDEVAQTVESDAEVEDEIRSLFEAIRS